MPTPSVAAAVVQKLGLLAACLAVAWFLLGPAALVYLLSYAYHAVNLQGSCSAESGRTSTWRLR